MSTTQQPQAPTLPPNTQPAEPSSDYETIRAIIDGWSPMLRTRLIHYLINTLIGNTEGSGPRKKTLHEALGLANNGGPTPNDEEVQRWLDEHREAKYG